MERVRDEIGPRLKDERPKRLCECVGQPFLKGVPFVVWQILLPIEADKSLLAQSKNKKSFLPRTGFSSRSSVFLLLHKTLRANDNDKAEVV